MDMAISFPELSGTTTPDLDHISSLFLKRFPEAWTEDADVTLYGDNGRFIRLSIVANPVHGLWLWHRQHEADGKETNHVSLGNPEKLQTYVDVIDDAVTLEGLFLPPALAWLAVRDFIELEGRKSEKISWLHEDDIPAGRHWLVSVDCL